MSVFTLTDQIRIQKAMLQLKAFQPVAIMLAHSDQEGLQMEVDSGRAKGLNFPVEGGPLTIHGLPVIKGHKTGILVELPQLKEEYFT